MWDCGIKQTRRESDRHNEEYLMRHMKSMKRAFDIEIQKRELSEKSVKLHQESLDNDTKKRELLEKKVTELKNIHKEAIDYEIQNRELLEREMRELKQSLEKSARDLEWV